jgi:AAA domain
MQSLDRVLADGSPVIRVPWPALAEQIAPGPGHVVLAIGAPGVGKSAFGLKWALGMDAPCLILSLDSDLMTQGARTVSALSGLPFKEVRAHAQEYQPFLREQFKSLPMMLDYPMGPGEIGEVLQAFEEFYGHRPELVVLDNLKDVVKGKNYESFDEALREIHRLARRHRTTFLVLHHINRGDGKKAQDVEVYNGKARPSLRHVQFAGDQDSEIVLGLWQGWTPWQGTSLMVSTIKYRFGPKDVDVPLALDMETMRLGD